MLDLLEGNGMAQLMARGLDLASRRQALIASNLANLDTPGYRTRDLDFEAALRASLPGQGAPISLRRTHAAHLAAAVETDTPPAGPPADATAPNAEGNDVSLDRESLLLAQTQQTYQAASGFLQVELRKLYGLIREAGAH